MKLNKLSVTFLVLVLGLALYAPQTSHASTPYYFGTLQTDRTKAATESAGGVKVAMMELSWSSYEPQDGVYDQNYINDQKDRLAKYQAAGMRVTLALGLHYNPGWVVNNYANSRYVNQYGNVGGGVNLTYNQPLRLKAEEYFNRVNQDLGLSNFWAIRLTEGGDAELLLPDMAADGTHTNSYWAFDPNAQNGVGKPPSMLSNPFPGWKPGQTTYNGSPFTTTQVQQWLDWYIKSSTNTVDWQAAKFDSLGFTGYYQVLTPGSGVRPNGYQDAINSYLTNSDWVTGRAAAWDKVYQVLSASPDKARIVAYVSSMADHSGNDDSCQSTDSTVSISDIQANNWSATRWVSRVADQYGFIKNGENPGYNSPSSFNAYYADTSVNGMMANTVRQMTSCNFQGMYWAHDDKLWDGTQSFSNYAGFIQLANGSSNPGDINRSGKVDILDYNLLITDYGATSGLGLRSDINNSGKVDILDYNLLITNFGKTYP